MDGQAVAAAASDFVVTRSISRGVRRSSTLRRSSRLKTRPSGATPESAGDLRHDTRFWTTVNVLKRAVRSLGSCWRIPPGRSQAGSLHHTIEFVSKSDAGLGELVGSWLRGEGYLCTSAASQPSAGPVYWRSSSAWSSWRPGCFETRGPISWA
jgi:hypothetical protein